MIPIREHGVCQRALALLDSGVLCSNGLCRKFAFETICAMVSPGDLGCTERENDDGDQFGSVLKVEMD
jgi:hypothetical protein